MEAWESVWMTATVLLLRWREEGRWAIAHNNPLLALLQSPSTHCQHQTEKGRNQFYRSFAFANLHWIVMVFRQKFTLCLKAFQLNFIFAKIMHFQQTRFSLSDDWLHTVFQDTMICDVLIGDVNIVYYFLTRPHVNVWVICWGTWTQTQTAIMNELGWTRVDSDSDCNYE